MKKILPSIVICVVSLLICSGCVNKPIPDVFMASFSTDVDEGTAPLSVNFSDTSTTPSGWSYTYYWTFGDGETSSGKNPEHTYQRPGIYLPKLVITRSDGNTSFSEYFITVNDPSENSPYKIYEKGVYSDSYVSELEPDVSHGLEPILTVNGDSYIFLTFKNFAVFSPIIDAKLKLYPIADITEEVEIALFTCSNHSWTDVGLTWNNMPQWDIGVINRTIIQGQQRYFYWNITKEINEHLSFDAITLVLVISTDQEVSFYSYNSDSPNTPKIEIKYIESL